MRLGGDWQAQRVPKQREAYGEAPLLRWPQAYGRGRSRVPARRFSEADESMMHSSHDRPTGTSSLRALAFVAAILAGALAVAVFASGPGSASAASRHGAHIKVPARFFGVQPGPTSIDSQDAAKIARTGVRTVRIGLNWLWVQPRPGPFNWSRVDEQIATLAASGVQALPTLAGSPTWVTDKPTTPPVGSSDKRLRWKTFVTATARRYGPDGTFWRPGPGGESPFHLLCHCRAAAVPITTWQVWNEPNLTHYFTPKPSAPAYATLLRATHTALREVDRKARVIMAGLSDGGTSEDVPAVTYLHLLYNVPRVKKTFDAAAVHPYAREVKGMKGVIKAIRKTMRLHHDGKTPLYISEIGWGSAHPNDAGTTKGIRGQRDILKESMRVLAEKRTEWHLRRVYWFFWRDPSKNVESLPCRICYSAGLLKHDGEAKPAYRSFKRIARRAR
jgi:polysaccharide biosynthesis protein PslG